MSRISERFADIRASGRTGLVTYVTAGDPDLDRTDELLLGLDRAGVDVLEVGVPFSDPLADGRIIQRAAERALLNGATLTRVLHHLAVVRERLSAPVVLFTYCNPVFRMGIERFRDRAVEAGIDGVLMLDLPTEEAGAFERLMSTGGIDTILLISPTTSDERLARAVDLGRGFLYAISRLGVTGTRDHLSADARALVERVRRISALPVAVGFGISKPEHVAEVGQFAEAAVVGSALVEVIAEAGGSEDVVDRAAQFVRWLKGEVGALSV